MFIFMNGFHEKLKKSRIRHPSALAVIGKKVGKARKKQERQKKGKKSKEMK